MANMQTGTCITERPGGECMQQNTDLFHKCGRLSLNWKLCCCVSCLWCDLFMVNGKGMTGM